ncbi:probable pterin-4-alpha-carbinolamine dehydratase, chloroplastic [Tanacetum coccineum]
MAVITTLTTFTPLHTFNTNQPLNFTHNHLLSLKSISRRPRTISLALGEESLGDFGARDPFPAEIETNFCDRVGVFDTEHKILIPNVAALSLAHQECGPINGPMSEDDAKSLLRKVNFVSYEVILCKYGN